MRTLSNSAVSPTVRVYASLNGYFRLHRHHQSKKVCPLFWTVKESPDSDNRLRRFITVTKKLPANKCLNHSILFTGSINIYMTFFFYLFFHSLHQFCQLLILPGYISIILPLVGQLAIGTVLNAFFCITEIASAFFAQRIEGTITEQAIKILFIRTLVAREIFTIFMAKERILFSFPMWFLHDSSCRSYNYNPLLSHPGSKSNIHLSARASTLRHTAAD